MFAPSIGGLMKKKSIQMKIKKKLRSKVFLFRSFKLYTRIVDFFLTLFIFRDESVMRFHPGLKGNILGWLILI